MVSAVKMVAKRTKSRTMTRKTRHKLPNTYLGDNDDRGGTEG